MIQEKWLPVKGFEGAYEVSNLGNVRSLKRDGGSLMALNKSNLGYMKVVLFFNGVPSYKSVHRLVAEAFIPNPLGLPCVNHKDENTSNNNVDNLEWCTAEYNNNYGTRNDKIKKAVTATVGQPVYQFDLEGNFVAKYKSLADAGRAVGQHASTIRHSCRGERGPVGGFLWQFAEKSK